MAHSQAFMEILQAFLDNVAAKSLRDAAEVYGSRGIFIVVGAVGREGEAYPAPSELEFRFLPFTNDPIASRFTDNDITYHATVEGTVTVWIIPEEEGKAKFQCHSMTVMEFSKTSFVYLRMLSDSISSADFKLLMVKDPAKDKRSWLHLSSALSSRSSKSNSSKTKALRENAQILDSIQMPRSDDDDNGSKSSRDSPTLDEMSHDLSKLSEGDTLNAATEAELLKTLVADLQSKLSETMRRNRALEETLESHESIGFAPPLYIEDGVAADDDPNLEKLSKTLPTTKKKLKKPKKKGSGKKKKTTGGKAAAGNGDGDGDGDGEADEGALITQFSYATRHIWTKDTRTKEAKLSKTLPPKKKKSSVSFSPQNPPKPRPKSLSPAAPSLPIFPTTTRSTPKPRRVTNSVPPKKSYYKDQQIAQKKERLQRYEEQQRIQEQEKRLKRLQKGKSQEQEYDDEDDDNEDAAEDADADDNEYTDEDADEAGQLYVANDLGGRSTSWLESQPNMHAPFPTASLPAFPPPRPSQPTASRSLARSPSLASSMPRFFKSKEQKAAKAAREAAAMAAAAGGSSGSVHRIASNKDMRSSPERAAARIAREEAASQIAFELAYAANSPDRTKWG